MPAAIVAMSSFFAVLEVDLAACRSPLILWSRVEQEKHIAAIPVNGGRATSDYTLKIKLTSIYLTHFHFHFAFPSIRFCFQFLILIFRPLLIFIFNNNKNYTVYHLELLSSKSNNSTFSLKSNYYVNIYPLPKLTSHFTLTSETMTWNI